MANIGFAPEYTTTTTVTSQKTAVKTSLRYDPSYIKKKEGILKAVQVISSFIGFICIQCAVAALHPTGKWFSTVSMFGVWITGLLLLCYIFHVIEKFYKIPWIKFEFGFCAIIALCFLIASSMTASFPDNAFRAAAFFGFCAMVAYAIDAFFKFLAIRSGELAQGERQTSRETTTVTTPQY